VLDRLSAGAADQWEPPELADDTDPGEWFNAQLR
jgi:hypothetical protein